LLDVLLGAVGVRSLASIGLDHFDDLWLKTAASRKTSSSAELV
jgi:hypothetical protein